MKLVHTLLFMLRENYLQQDMEMAEKCLKSLEKSTYKTVIVFNQGVWSNEQLEDYLKSFQIDCIVIGDGTNKGIVAGRQNCFEYIWQHFMEAAFISELHLDMVFTYHWDDILVDYLSIHDEPVIGCGIVDKNGVLHFTNTAAETSPAHVDCMDDYLNQLKQDSTVYGFSHPCIHKLEILREIGGYDTHFLKGKQAFEDDSLLLGYYYYYGTKANWKPKVSYQSVVYHEGAGQRAGVNGNVMTNYTGLVKQYGAMGIKHLAQIQQNEWSVNYFAKQFYAMQNEE